MSDETLGSLQQTFQTLVSREWREVEQAAKEVRQVMQITVRIVAQHPSAAESTLSSASQALTRWQDLASSHSASLSPESDPMRLSILLHTLYADMHKSQNHLPLALKSLQKALKFTRFLTPIPIKRLSKAKILLNISAIYSDFQSFEKALNRAKKALKLIKPHLKSADLSEIGTDFALTAAQIMHSIGVYNENLGNLQDAEKAFRAGEGIFKEKLKGKEEIWTGLERENEEKEEEIQRVSSASFRTGLKTRALELFPAPESRTFGKYYSEKQLKSFQKRQTSNFLSSDQYFHRKISKAFGVLKPVPSTSIVSTRLEDRRTVATLRSRKKPPIAKITISNRGDIHIKEELLRLEINAKETASRNEVRFKSHSHTQGFRETLTNIARVESGEKRFYPPQSEV